MSIMPTPEEYGVLGCLVDGDVLVSEVLEAIDPDIANAWEVQRRMYSCMKHGWIIFTINGWRMTPYGTKAYNRAHKQYEPQCEASAPEIDIDATLKLLIEEGKKDREDVNASNGQFSVDERRGVATMVGKLEEALFWKDTAKGYYEKR